MKRMSNYVLFSGLIMTFVSMSVGLLYRFTSLELNDVEKSNIAMLYLVGAVMVMITAAYKIFKEQK